MDEIDDCEIVLLAVTGMSPSILTETIWALGEEGTLPDRVIAITTTTGAAQIEAELLTPKEAFGGRSAMESLRLALERKGHDTTGKLRFEIRPIQRWDEEARCYVPLPDIRTPEENTGAADFIMEQIRTFTEVDDVRIIASLAGGRKTMGALLYACMSLLGREDDRLTHVLVSEPYDTLLPPGFFFPGQPCQTLSTRDGRTVQASDGVIQLADVPFVPLRNLFERDLVKRRHSFNALVQACRKQVRQPAPHLRLWRSRREVEVNGTPVATSAMQQLLLLYLAAARLGKKPMHSKYVAALDELGSYAAELRVSDPGDWRHGLELPRDMDDQRLRQLLDQLKTKLKAAGYETATLIPYLPKRGRFGLNLPLEKIELLD